MYKLFMIVAKHTLKMLKVQKFKSPEDSFLLKDYTSFRLKQTSGLEL